MQLSIKSQRFKQIDFFSNNGIVKKIENCFSNSIALLANTSQKYETRVCS